MIAFGVLFPSFLLSLAAGATPLDPLSFTSLGSFNPGGNVTIDTTALTITGGASFTGVVGPDGIAVFTFDDISISSGLSVSVTGSRPVALLSQGDASIAGAVFSNGLSQTPGAGGGTGGSSGSSGGGPGGGGGIGSSVGGAAGGGFGGAGGRGSTFGIGGSSYGDLSVLLEGGSGGGGTGNPSAVGGGGGGGIEIGAVGEVSFSNLGNVSANGGAGLQSGSAAGGGGSGGAILIHGARVDRDTSLSARGGVGQGSPGLYGGSGGGGRVLVLADAYTIGQDAVGGVSVDAGSANGGGSFRGQDGVSRFEVGTTIVPDGATLDNFTGGAGFSTAAAIVQPGGQVEVTGTRAFGAIDSAGTYVQTDGELQGSLTSTGVATFSGDAVVTGAVDNALAAQLDVAPGDSLTAASIGNGGSMTFDGFLTAATTTNRLGGTIVGRGTIDGDLVNDGVFDTTGALVVTGLMTNGIGSIELPAGESLQADGGLSNTGIVALDGGVIASASGIVTNGAGGVIRGRGAITAPVTNAGGLVHANASDPLVVADLGGGNLVGGELRVDDGSTLIVQSAFSSSGNVVLGGTNAALSGGALSNAGTLSGVGRVSNALTNTGVLRAEGGRLTLAGAGNTNAAGGRLEAASGDTLLFTQGLAANAGDIALTGGAFDNNNQALVNAGSILGRGTVRTGDLTNQGTIEFADGDSDVFGAVTNEGDLDVTANTTTFFDLVTNTATGTIKNTAGTARFLGGLVNSGAFISDPADNEFTDIVLDATGYLVGGEGDRFLVTGDVLSSSEASVLWSTLGAELALIGGGDHVLQYSAEDRGATRRGYDDNMAWGTLRLGLGDSLVLADGDATPGGAIYVASLVLDGGLSQIASITGNGTNVYYDPNVSDNAMLGGQTFSLLGGGAILPVPEPGTATLLGLGLVLLASRRAQDRIVA